MLTMTCFYGHHCFALVFGVRIDRLMQLRNCDIPKNHLHIFITQICTSYENFNTFIMSKESEN